MEPAMMMQFFDEDRAFYALDYVSLKNEEYNRKNLQQRNLGDMNGRYKRAKSPSTPNLVGSLVNLDFPEARAINLTSADKIINDQRNKIRQQFHRNHREAILDEWARPPSVLIDKPAQVNENPGLRPQTAPGYHSLNHKPFQSGPTPRPYSTGIFRTPPRNPPQPSGFLWVKMKHKGSAVKDVSFRKITDQIHDYWENEDKREREKRRRTKSENVKRHDLFAGQWLSFAGNGTDASNVIVDAFTGKGEIDHDEYYNIDGKVGSLVARQLQAGNRLYIGRNGELQSETLKVKEWKQPLQRRETAEDVLRNFHNTSRLEAEKTLNKPACLIPLDWSEQVVQPDVKVLGISKPVTPPPKPDLCDRHPVVYSKLIPGNEKPKIHIKLDKYCIRHRSKPKRNSDGTESLSQRITMITVDDLTKDEQDNEAMSMDEYQELLKRKLDSVQVNEGTPGDSHPDLMQRLSPRMDDGMPREKSVSLSSLGKGSDISGGTVEKPPTPILISKENLPSRKERVTTALPSHPRTMVRQQRSAPAMAVRKAASSSTSNPVMSPSSEMTRRTDRYQLPGRSRRVQSSTSRRYDFDRSATPQSIHSPRVKRGQFFRSGVPSINNGPREGEQEYIKISHQIPSPYHHTSLEVPSGFLGEEAEISGPPSPGSMDGSISSLNVFRERDNQHMHEGISCNCTDDAKRALSAALSRSSIPRMDHGPFINIPTAPISPGGFSDLHSGMDARRLSQASITHRSQTDDDFDQYSEKEDLSDIDDLVGEFSPLNSSIEEESSMAARQLTSDIIPQHPTSDDVIINHEDGLQVDGSTLIKREERNLSPNKEEAKRTVTFREDFLEPTTPTTTPLSSPRMYDEPENEVELDLSVQQVVGH